MQYSSVKQLDNSQSFLSRVFGYFGLAILASLAGTYSGFVFFAETLLATPALMYVLFAVELGLIFTSRMWMRKKPLSYFLFFAFAFITGVTLFPILAVFAVEFGMPIIIKALLATTLMFAATAIFGWTTKANLQGLSGFLWIGLIGLLITGILGIFIPWNNQFEMIYAGIGVLIFGVYTMVDIQRLKMLPDDSAMDAALMLYLDIFNLFIFILRLMGAVGRD